MTNKEKFYQVFGDESKLPPRQCSTKDWWEQEYIVPEQEPCDKCEVGNPCLYCKHDFEEKGKLVSKKQIDTDDDVVVVSMTDIECEDAISREAAITIASLHTLTVDESVEAIKRLPSVQPSRTQMVDKSNFDIRQYRADLDSAYECGKASVQPSRKGQWIESDVYENIYNCSKCGSAGYDTFNFCPNCGADMRGAE